jgi:hypothetical protein
MWLVCVALFILRTSPVFAQDNGNDFNLIWDDPDEIIAATLGYFQYGTETYQTLQVVNDYDGNGFKEVVGWDGIEEHYFVIEADGDDSFGLKRTFSFFPFFIDLNDDGIDEAINLDLESDPDSVVIQIVSYDAALDSFVIDRDLGKFVKPGDEFLLEFYIDKGNFDDDANSEFVIFSYDRWVNPYGGVTLYLVVFELTGNDLATAGIKIEHLETISTPRFKALATITAADLDNDGKREMVLVSIERKRIFIYESQGEDQYEFVFETGRYGRDALHTFKSHTYIGDLDGDGLEDLWYSGSHGTVYVIPGRGNYDSTFTYENSAKIYEIPGATEIQGGAVGDADGDGKPNIYWWDLSTEAIYQMEYQGGDLRDPSNYLFSMIYQADRTDNELTRFEGINIGGVKTGTLDLDNDGKREFVIGSSNPPEQGVWPRLYIFESVNVTTGVSDDRPSAQRPVDYVLLGGFPNPARSQTMLQYELLRPSAVTLNVYNLRGQLIRTLDKGVRAAGTYRVRFDTRDLPSGIYFARLVTKFGQKTFKLLVSK